jgi:hypothetical protein
MEKDTAPVVLRPQGISSEVTRDWTQASAEYRTFFTHPCTSAGGGGVPQVSLHDRQSGVCYETTLSIKQNTEMYTRKHARNFFYGTADVEVCMRT